MSQLTESKLSPTEYYNKHLKELIEETDDSLYRSDQMRYEDLIEVAIHPDLSDECRVHLLRRAWFQIQRKMINEGLVSLDVFSKSMDSHVFAIKDDYYYYLVLKYKGELDTIYEDIKKYPNLIPWFKKLAMTDRECPKEIVQEFYSKV